MTSWAIAHFRASWIFAISAARTPASRERSASEETLTGLVGGCDNGHALSVLEYAFDYNSVAHDSIHRVSRDLLRILRSRGGGRGPAVVGGHSLVSLTIVASAGASEPGCLESGPDLHGLSLDVGGHLLGRAPVAQRVVSTEPEPVVKRQSTLVGDLDV